MGPELQVGNCHDHYRHDNADDYGHDNDDHYRHDDDHDLTLFGAFNFLARSSLYIYGIMMQVPESGAPGPVAWLVWDTCFSRL